MKYIVYENFNGNVNLVTDPETGDTVILESLEAAIETANDCQGGFVVPLNVDLISLAEDNADFMTDAYDGELLDIKQLQLNAEICGRQVIN